MRYANVKLNPTSRLMTNSEKLACGHTATVCAVVGSDRKDRPAFWVRGVEITAVTRYNESMRTDACEALERLPTGTVAAMLGDTARTVYRLVNGGALPAFKVGRLIPFRSDDVNAYMEGARVPPGSLDHLVTSNLSRT